MVMRAAVNPSIFITLGVGLLIAWRLYARVRRSIGKQKLSRPRSWLVVCLFPAGLMVTSVMTSVLTPLTLVAFFGSALGGIALGYYGLRLTRFEVTAEGFFYTPSAHIGIALSLLFVIRIAYRGFHWALPAANATTPSTAFTSSPLTLIMFAMLAGYYVTYAVGLLRWHGRYRADSEKR